MILRRDETLTEHMDDPSADSRILRRTYERFKTVNRLLARWDGTYEEHIRPNLKPGEAVSILDVGSGAGDVALHLRKRLLRDGFQPTLVLIDPSDQVQEYFKSRPLPPDVSYQKTTTSALAATGKKFDIIISNHLLHHLATDDVAKLMEDCRTMCRKRVVFSDLDRNVFAWALFAVFAWPISFGTFIHTDGLRSIRRSFNRQELIDLLPGGWSVHRQFPFRLLVMRDADY